MKYYYLYLDESGDFRETKGYPSIVAGYLLEDQGLADKAAQELMVRVKTKEAAFSAVPLQNFHGMKLTSVPGSPAYIVALLEALVQGKHARIVVFQNQEKNVIVNSDRTYLNVFASGILALLQTLLEVSKKDPEGFQLNILYAQRVDTVFYDEYGHPVPIGTEEYQLRIRERIELLLAKLPSADRNRLHLGAFKRAKATADASLMIADAICFALGCDRRSFSKGEREAVDALMPLTYVVPEKEAWERIKECFLQNRTADAILLWYGLFADEIPDRKQAFESLLTHYYEGADTFERSITEQIISQYMLQLTNRRSFDSANKLMAALQKGFFPLMDSHGIALDKMKFDLHFHRLTTATHEGNTHISQQEMNACRKLLPCLPKTYESLGYYMKYKLREIEHLKNIYAFSEALELLGKQRDCLENILGVLEDVGDLGAYQKGVTSDTLGKIYGSMMQIRTFLARRDATQIPRARMDFESSVAQFSSEAQKRREYQYRSALETIAGIYDNALTYLARAVNCDVVAPAPILTAILPTTNAGAQIFALAAYANLMDQALRNGHPLGQQLYDAWQSKNGEVNTLFPKEKHDEYPRTLILWHFGAACAQLGDRSAKNYYTRAIKASLPSGKDGFATYLPNIATALVMELDRVILIESDRAANIKALHTHYNAFRKINLPTSMHDYFVQWEKELQKLTPANVVKERETLLSFVHQTPVL